MIMDILTSLFLGSNAEVSIIFMHCRRNFFLSKFRNQKKVKLRKKF